MSEKAYRTFLATAVGGIFVIVAWVFVISPAVDFLSQQYRIFKYQQCFQAQLDDLKAHPLGSPGYDSNRMVPVCPMPY